MTHKQKHPRGKRGRRELQGNINQSNKDYNAMGTKEELRKMYLQLQKERAEHLCAILENILDKEEATLERSETIVVLSEIRQLMSFLSEQRRTHEINLTKVGV